MNNVAKFISTREAIKRLQKQLPKLQEEADQLYEKGRSSKKHLKIIRKIMYIGGLFINDKKDIMSFNINELYYVQPIWIRKGRINAVPCCFLVQLYKENLKKVNLKQNEKVDIPFKLRGFWKMDRVLKFFNELSRIQVSCTRSIQRMLNYKHNNTEKVGEALKNLSEAIEEIKILSPKKGCIEVKAGNETFTVKMKNSKLDVVPLCKFIAVYYVDIIDKVSECVKISTDDLVVKGAVTKMLNEFEELIKRYFIIPIMH